MNKKLVKCLVLLMLVAAFLVMASACKKQDKDPEPTATATATEEPTPDKTDEQTPEPTEEPTPEPTEEPTPEPTEEPDPVIHIQDDFSDPEKSKNEWELQAFKVENGKLIADFNAYALQARVGGKLSNFTLAMDVVFLEHKPDTENYIGCWIGPNLMESKIIAGFWPKDKKVKILENNKDGTRLLKDATVSEIGLNEEFHLAIKLTSDNTIKIYINKQLVLEHTNTSLYKHDNIGFFWNNNNHIAIDNLVLADEHYRVEQ
ncbi:MAG TPA: hypothetical protein PKM70_13390 [Clostridia bacterium]|jgi:hypothetical protein|nr:hypothetical protein [Clostridia bacterium]